MELDLSAFHFLRPWWLLGVLPAGLLWWARLGELGAYGRDSRIAPALLPFLTVQTHGSRGPRPVDLLALILVVGVIAAAGPAWQRDEPTFLDNVAPLIVAVDLSASMDGADVPPTRLEAAKNTLRDLAARRTGAKTGLIAYSGSSHMVLPPTDDLNLLDLFIQALSTDLIDQQGRDAAGAIELGASMLAAERAGGTLLLMTDGADLQQLDAVQERAQAASDMQVLVMVVGHANGDIADIDTSALRNLASAAGASLGSLTGNSDDDLDWIMLHAQQHFRSMQDTQSGSIHWKDAGYWLCWPLALLALLTIRRGWNVTWAACLLASVMLVQSPNTYAGTLENAFLTADQQGRMAFERGHYDDAAQHFHDPYWKGISAYEAGDYQSALAAFSLMQSAEGYFYVGNTQARLRQYDAALAAYDQALSLRPQWQPAVFNRDIVTRLLDDMSQEQQEGQVDPDRTINDKTAQAGKMVKVPVAQAASEDMWLRNLTISPARFLRGKFAAEDAAAGETP